jgi:hypothetical protein
MRFITLPRIAMQAVRSYALKSGDMNGVAGDAVFCAAMRVDALQAMPCPSYQSLPMSSFASVDAPTE